MEIGKYPIWKLLMLLRLRLFLIYKADSVTNLLANLKDLSKPRTSEPCIWQAFDRKREREWRRRKKPFTKPSRFSFCILSVFFLCGDHCFGSPKYYKWSKANNKIRISIFLCSIWHWCNVILTTYKKFSLQKYQFKN